MPEIDLSPSHMHAQASAPTLTCVQHAHSTHIHSQSKQINVIAMCFVLNNSNLLE